jgi:hypothetical protein
MKPRPSEPPLLTKAREIEHRLNQLEKAQPGFKAEKITDVNPAFMAESGGQTKSGYFTTNGKTIETEDVPKKKKGKDATNMEQLSTRMNPHAGGGVDREDRMGERKQ